MNRSWRTRLFYAVSIGSLATCLWLTAGRVTAARSLATRAAAVRLEVESAAGKPTQTPPIGKQVTAADIDGLLARSGIPEKVVQSVTPVAAAQAGGAALRVSLGPLSLEQLAHLVDTAEAGGQQVIELDYQAHDNATPREAVLVIATVSKVPHASAPVRKLRE